MLSCKDLSVDVSPKGPRILDRATAQFKGAALNAVQIGEYLVARDAIPSHRAA
jgi:hypothetical protein